MTMIHTSVNVLLVDGDERDYINTRRLLAEIKQTRFNLEWAADYTSGLNTICSNRHDICLVDYHLGPHSGLDLVNEAHSTGCTTPMILLTGMGDLEIDVDAVTSGAADYLVKGMIDAPVLNRAIRYAIERNRMIEQLQKAHNELETRVEERIRELTTTNAALLREIEERKRTEQELRRSVARERARIEDLSALMEILPTPIWIAHDPRCELVTGNTASYELLHVPHGSNVSRRKAEIPLPYTSYINGEPVGEGEGPMHLAIRTARPVLDAEIELRYDSGEIRHIYGNTVPLFNESGGVRGALGAFIDVTARKIAEEEARRLNEELEHRVAERTRQLEASSRELESFCYSISHDLRAPLRSIDGFSQALMDEYGEKIEGEGIDYLVRVRSSAQRMGKLIDDLLDMSRVTRTAMERQRIDLGEIARRIIAQLDREENRRVEFCVDEHIEADADPRLLQIALRNMLDNSWKFTRRTRDARVEFGSRRDGNETIYFIRDNGAGFNMIYAHKLFRSFQRLHSPAEYPGHGVGLATVQRIIHRHGGRIWADAEVDRGATFYFTLEDSA